jgi:ERCC4-type nuclease
MTIRVSPTEPPSLRAIGRTTLLPERFGADIAWASRLGSVGVQRKEFPGDFIGSVTDGRLGEQIAKLQRVAVRALILEGRGTWTTDGELVTSWGQPWTLEGHWKLLMSVQLRGVWVFQVNSLDETIALVKAMHAWSNKAEHRSLDSRPKAKGAWGKPTDKEFACHFLTAFDGVGPEMAGRIFDRFGRIPLTFTVTPEEMEMVHGVGKKTIDKMYGALADE